MSISSRRVRTLAPALLLIGALVPTRSFAEVLFGSPIPLDTDATTDTRNDDEPRVATDEMGTWVAVWDSDRGVEVSRSTDAGTTWSPPAQVNTIAGTEVAGVSLATDGAGVWVAAWTYRAGFTTDSDIQTARSTDGGITWTPTAYLNTDATVDSIDDQDVEIATDKMGTWIAVWRRYDQSVVQYGDTDLMFARSTDGGVTWSAPAPLNTDAATDRALDQEQDLVFDGMGHWIVVWLRGDVLGSNLGTDNDVVMSRSDDGGVTWSPPTPVNTDAATDDRQDFEPRIATDGAGTLIATWGGREPHTDTEIFIARSTDAGSTWTPPAYLNTTAATDIGDDAGIHVATDGAGRWVAVWMIGDLPNDVGTDTDLYVAQSTDNGITWSDPAILNPTALTDDGANEFAPRVVTDRAGTWLVTWDVRRNTADPVYGADSDVFVLRGVEGGCAPTPLSTCRGSVAPRAGRLALTDREGAKPDQLQWKFTKGEATGSGDFGNPIVGTDSYSLCMYDASPAIIARTGVIAGGTCGAAPCWKGAKGFKYRNPAGLPGGLTALLLKPGDEGRAKILVKGKSTQLPLPPLPLALPVRVQFQASNGNCWESTFSSSGVVTSDAARFKAKSD